MIAALTAGTSLHVSLQNLAGQAIEFDIPLAGFGAAYERIR